jgi:hypothetical protein
MLTVENKISLAELEKMASMDVVVLQEQIKGLTLLLKSKYYWQERFISFRDVDCLEAAISKLGEEIASMERKVQLQKIILSKG